MNTARHVIFGTGAIGLATFDALRRRGETVRLVNRSGHARVPDNVEVVGGDAADPAFAVAVTEGASVLYQTLNPPYHEWTAQFPALQAGVLAAADANGARLVRMENVYMYGRPNGQPLTEDRPYAAHTKKGQLRGRMARELLAAHHAGRVQVAIGRASDYFGPRGGGQPNLGDRVCRPALDGKTATVLGDPDASSAPRHRCSCAPAASSIPPFVSSPRCSTSSRSPSSSTAARSSTKLGGQATAIGQALADTLVSYRYPDDTALPVHAASTINPRKGRP